ncbi:MAG TPA: hypothetical protein QGH10_12535 [Armatimonadota bacterium]|nr:hypothetical protein [Armatimonadota bacterium]
MGSSMVGLAPPGSCRPGRDPETGADGLLQKELLSFQAQAPRGDSTGSVMVKFGTQSGVHDDSVYAVAIAFAALAEQPIGSRMAVAGGDNREPARRRPHIGSELGLDAQWI